jgi:hypothetical protein
MAIIDIDPRALTPASVVSRGRGVKIVGTHTGAGDPGPYGGAAVPVWHAPTAHVIAV